MNNVNIFCEANANSDYSKINKELGWSPSTSFEAMVEKMVKFDLDIANGRIDYFGI